MDARVDLHVHSRRSDRPREWLLRRLGSAESYASPREVHDACRARGMDFVTLTDHDTIDGALEIAELPDTFLSCELTAAFPADGCEVHLLVWGLDEAQHRELQRRRADLHAVRDYLCEQDLAHAVAHPLCPVDDRFGIGHLERLLVMFKTFEGLNGAREPREGIVLRAVLANLTPQLLADLADRHRLEPRDPQPWRKHLVGGSDDHGGLYAASAWTETSPAPIVDELLAHLRAGRMAIAGEPGSSLRLGRSLQRIAQCFLAERLDRGDGGQLLEEVLGRLVAGQAPGARERLRLVTAALPRPLPGGRGLETMAKVLGSLPSDLGQGRSSERRSFELASRLGQRLAWEGLDAARTALQAGRLGDALESLGVLPAAAAALAPYLCAFETQHRSEPLVRAVATRFPAAQLLRRRGERWAWVTDTLVPGDGALRPLLGLAGLAGRRRESATVLTCGSGLPFHLPGRTFDAVGTLAPAEAAGIAMQVPPLLEVVEHCERERVEEVVVATPGPMGLAGWLVARLLRLRLLVLHQLDLPGLVRQRTGSSTLEGLAWAWLGLLWRDADLVLVADAAEGRALAARGVAPRKLRLLPRAVDRRFAPARREPDFWRRRGLGSGCKLLRVGPLLADEPTERLLAAVTALRAEGVPAQLVIAGEGPALGELSRRYHDAGVLFLGAVDEDELAVAYASADLFVEADTADLRAHRLCEALASGLPAVVAAGPGAQLVRAHDAGLVVCGDASAWRDGLRAMVLDAPRRAAAARGASAAASGLASWEEAFTTLGSTTTQGAGMPAEPAAAVATATPA